MNPQTSVPPIPVVTPAAPVMQVTPPALGAAPLAPTGAAPTLHAGPPAPVPLVAEAPPHEMLVIEQAIDMLLLRAREARDIEKREQYGGVSKESIYASELGDGDRKLVYKFYQDELGVQSSVTAQNLRLFDNGDYVHLRYADYMDRMGALLSYEEPLRTTQAEMEGRQLNPDGTGNEGGYKVSGRYDQIVDMHVIRAYVQGPEYWAQFMQSYYDPHTILTQSVDQTTGAVVEQSTKTKWVPKAGYQPDKALLDIKSMNEFSFKSILNNDHSKIGGYVDQLQYYAHRSGIHKTALVIEDKGKQQLKVIPVDYDPQRVHGGGLHEGLSARISRVWAHVRSKVVPDRCPGHNRDKFPCIWSTGRCDFYSHCWNEEHNGYALPGQAAEQQAEEQGVRVEDIAGWLAEPTYGIAGVQLYLENFPGGQAHVTLLSAMFGVVDVQATPDAQEQQKLQVRAGAERMLKFYEQYVYNFDLLDSNMQVLNYGGASQAEAQAASTQEAQQAEVTPTPEPQPLAAPPAPPEPEDVYPEPGKEPLYWKKKNGTDMCTMPDGGVFAWINNAWADDPRPPVLPPVPPAPPTSSNTGGQGGNLADAANTPVQERRNSDGFEINCGKCNHLVTYKQLRNGIKPCTAPGCDHVNPVIRAQ